MTMSVQQERLIHILLQEVVSGQTPPDLTERLAQRLFPARRRPIRWMMPLAAVAAGLLLVAGLWGALQLRSYPSPAASGDYRIESGRLDRGATLVAGPRSAELVLGGYAHVDIAPASRVRVEGARRDEKIYLEKGQAACKVDRHVGAFAVATDVGTVSVTGTEFTVRVVDTGAEAMQKRMIVKVLAGAVMLTGAWGSTPLSAGQERTFTAANTAKPIYGKVVSVDAAAGNVVLTATGGEQKGQQLTVSTDANTKILVENKPAALDAIKAGMVIRVVPGTGAATEIRAFTPKAPAPAPAPAQPKAVYGKVVSVDAATGNIVITVGKGDATKQVTVATDANTKILVDGKAGGLEAIKAGMIVRAVPAEGTATEIRAFTPKS